MLLVIGRGVALNCRRLPAALIELLRSLLVFGTWPVRGLLGQVIDAILTVSCDRVIQLKVGY